MAAKKATKKAAPKKTAKKAASASKCRRRARACKRPMGIRRDGGGTNSTGSKKT